jgi:hypothetical protein
MAFESKLGGVGARTQCSNPPHLPDELVLIEQKQTVLISITRDRYSTGSRVELGARVLGRFLVELIQLNMSPQEVQLRLVLAKSHFIRHEMTIYAFAERRPQHKFR